jgi:ATP-dependent Lon protease
VPPAEPDEDHYTILYGETGHTYETIMGKYLNGCKEVHVEDPHIRRTHQIQNFIRFCELCARSEQVRLISLTTGYDNQEQRADAEEKFEMLQESLSQAGVELRWTFSDTIHDREIKLDNGWIIKIGRGFDIYQKPDNWFTVGSQDLSLRPCLETKVDIYKEN